MHLFNYSLTAHFSFTQNTNYKSQYSTSCTTTSLFYVILSKNSSSLAHASKKTRKRMQRYDFFLNYQIFLRKFFIKTQKKSEWLIYVNHPNLLHLIILYIGRSFAAKIGLLMLFILLSNVLFVTMSYRRLFYHLSEYLLGGYSSICYTPIGDTPIPP